MDIDSTCSFPVIEIDSQTNSPNRLHSQIKSPLRLDENLLSSDEIAVINREIVANTKNTRDSKINTVLSIPSKFPGEPLNLISKLCLSFPVIPHHSPKLSRNPKRYQNYLLWNLLPRTYRRM